MKYKVDVVRIRENSITLNGWALGKTPESKVTFRVEDEHHQPVKCKMVSTRRDDVSQIYFKKVIDKEFGFDIQFPYERGKSYWLLIRCDGRQAKIKYNEELITKRASVAHKRMEKIKDLMNMETVHVALDFWKENGLRALIKKSCHKIQGLDNDYDYGEWYELTKPTEEELKAQRETHFEKEPLFSVVIPVYKTPERYLKEMLDSILDQTYGNWEVCIADGSPRGQDVEKVLKKYAQKDSRIRYEILGGNRGISGNTNAALAMAKGEYVILADHDDTIPPQAFYEVAKAINKHPDCDVLYSDEDKLDMDGKALFDPHFKPDFNPDLLTSVNYICHLFVVKKELLDQVGGFRQEFDGAQDYDFIFRCTEQAKEIVHIPQVLYHWRCHQDSTASNPESKMYAFEAGSRAIMAHYERMGIPAERVEKGVDYGIYHTTFKIKGEPLISIIIPNKDHSKDLDVCVRSILEKSTYRNLEFIIVENNSTEPETFAYYKKMEEKHPSFHVVTWKEGFNYSAINNFGASFAKGEAGTHLSAKHLADFLVVLSGKVFSVNFHQNISGFQAYIGSRHILVWLRYHGTFQFRIPSNHRTYTTIGILQHLLQFALVIFRIILRVGVQRVEHGINAFTDSLVRINRIHVKHIQLFHNGIEYIQILCYLETTAITTLKPPKTNGSRYNQQGNHPHVLTSFLFIPRRCPLWAHVPADRPAGSPATCRPSQQ